MRAISQSQRAKVTKAIEQHQSYRNAWFWTPPSSASGRRSMEKRNNWSVEFRHEGVDYRYVSAVNCSIRNVYYNGFFRANGERVTVRRFKKLAAR